MNMDTSTDTKSPILTSVLQDSRLQSLLNCENNSDQISNTDPAESSGNQDHVLSILDSIDPSKTEAVIVYESETENETDGSFKLFVDFDSKDGLPDDNGTVDKIVAGTVATKQEINHNVDENSSSSTLVSVKSSSSNMGAVMNVLSTNVNSVKIVQRANRLKNKIKQQMQRNVDPKLVMKVTIPLVKLDHQPIWKKMHNGTVTLGRANYHSRTMIRKVSKIELKGNIIRDVKHWAVVLERLPTHVLERFGGGGYLRRGGRVRLPDIEQVRREHGRMLTAEVKPLAAATRASGSIRMSALSFVEKGLCHGARVVTLVPAAQGTTDHSDGATACPPAASEPISKTSSTSTANVVGQTLSGNQAATDVITRVETTAEVTIELSDNEENVTDQESNDEVHIDAHTSRSDFSGSYKHFVQHIDLNRLIGQNHKTEDVVAAFKQMENINKVRASKIESVQKANLKKKAVQKPKLFQNIIRLAKDAVPLRAGQVPIPNMRIETQKLTMKAAGEQNSCGKSALERNVVDLTNNERVQDLEDALSIAVIPTNNPSNRTGKARSLTITNIYSTPPPPAQTHVAPQNDLSQDQNRSFVGQIINRNGVPVVINNRTQMINQNRHLNIPTANNIPTTDNIPTVNNLNVTNTTMEGQNQPPIMLIPSAQNNNVILGYPPQSVEQPMVPFHQNLVVNQQAVNQQVINHQLVNQQFVVNQQLVNQQNLVDSSQQIGGQNVFFAQPNCVPFRPNVITTENNSLPQIIVESNVLNQMTTENIEMQNHQTLNLPPGSYLILSPNLNQPNTVNVIRHNTVPNVMPTAAIEQPITPDLPMHLMPQISNVRSLAVSEQFVPNDDSQTAIFESRIVMGAKGLEVQERMKTDADEASFVPGAENSLELHASMPRNARDVLASAGAVVLARVPRRASLWTLDTGYLVFTDSVLSLGDWSMFALMPKSVCVLIRGEHELPSNVIANCRLVGTNNRKYVMVVSDDINSKTDPPGGDAAAPPQEKPRIKVKSFASVDNFNNRNRGNKYSIKDEDRVNSLYEYTNNSNSLNCKDNKNTLNSNKIEDVNETICKKDANMMVNDNTDNNNGGTYIENSLNTDVSGNASADSVNKENEDAEITDTVVTSDPSNSLKMDCEDSNENIDQSDSCDSSEKDSNTTHSDCNTACKNSVSCDSVKHVNSDKSENQNNSNELDIKHVNKTQTEVKNDTETESNTIDANKLNSSGMDVDSSNEQCSNNTNINNNTDNLVKTPEVENSGLVTEQKNPDNVRFNKVNDSDEVSESAQSIDSEVMDVDNELDINNSNVIVNKNIDSPTEKVSSEVIPSATPSVKVNSDKKTLRRKHNLNYLVVSDRKRNYFRLSQQQNIYARMISCVSSASLGFKHAMRGFPLLLYSAEESRVLPVRACRHSRRLLCLSGPGCSMCNSGDWRHRRTLQLLADCFNQLDTEGPEWRCVPSTRRHRAI